MVILDKLVGEISDILKREIRSFTNILELLILEEKSLIECNTEALLSVLERQEDVFSSIACLEKSRMDVLMKITELTGEAPENYSVSRLTEEVNEPLKNELIETGHILASLYEDIQMKKISNSVLIRQSLMLVESDIRLILNAASRHEQKENMYTSQAETGLSTRSVCIDERR
ncbi:flagellar export chaperone FlgN [Candidatus Latescibacterota bacterium]